MDMCALVCKRITSENLDVSMWVHEMSNDS
jgi:hypothetical protein